MQVLVPVFLALLVITVLNLVPITKQLSAQLDTSVLAFKVLAQLAQLAITAQAHTKHLSFANVV